METIACIANRVSIREYNASPLSREVLEMLVDCGRRAPTARAVEPWHFVVVTAKECLIKLASLAPTGGFLRDAAACIVVFCQDTKYYLEDGCAATENILLAAADQGLGACWIAGDKKEFAPEVSLLLDAPDHMKLVSLISLGYPLKGRKQSKKLSLQDVLHWEKFAAKTGS
ncbi:MAG: nitroreductase family protein [Candidatus Omnitrophota bacterium]|jgi:nitroreductase